jgi:hypothetical protein
MGDEMIRIAKQSLQTVPSISISVTMSWNGRFLKTEVLTLTDTQNLGLGCLGDPGFAGRQIVLVADPKPKIFFARATSDDDDDDDVGSNM